METVTGAVKSLSLSSRWVAHLSGGPFSPPTSIGLRMTTHAECNVRCGKRELPSVSVSQRSTAVVTIIQRNARLYRPLGGGVVSGVLCAQPMMADILPAQVTYARICPVSSKFSARMGGRILSTRAQQSARVDELDGLPRTSTQNSRRSRERIEPRSKKPGRWPSTVGCGWCRPRTTKCDQCGDCRAASRGPAVIRHHILNDADRANSS